MTPLLLLALAGADDKPALPKVAVTLTISVKEYDPFTPSKGVVKCVVRNDDARAVSVPAEYDGRLAALVAPAGERPLTLRDRDRFAEARLVEVAPGKERVVFELPLDEVLLQTPGAAKKWSWGWDARPQPPKTPLHQFDDKEGFVEQADFRAVLKVGGAEVKSDKVVLKVKPSKAPRKDGP
jgi:hypothetical protein